MRRHVRKSLERIAAIRFRNEAEIQRYFIPPLLELLGYEVPQDAPAEKQLEFKIAYAGREKVRLKVPDFLVRVGERTLLVIETKGPSEKLDQQAIEQALSYARHDDIRAPLTMLTNGHRMVVLETDTRHPVLDVTHERLVDVYRDLYLLLAKETLGSTLAGHLRLVRPVGKGAFGVVYEAMNMRVKRKEAVKIFNFPAADREGMRRRFRQGTIAHAQIEHPNVVRFYGMVEYGNELAVCMEFIDGLPIDKWIQKAAPSIRDRALLLAAAAETIQFAHEHEVVHRDLKPSNILVVADGKGWRPVIVDFDTAVVLGEMTITQSAERFGAYGYIDPEMLDSRSRRERRDPRSDVYSLGRVLEFMLTGQHPRPGRSLRELDMKIRKALAKVEIREQNLLLEVLLPAIAERREERTQTAGALASDLRAVFDERASGDLNAKEYAEEVFRQIDGITAAQQLPLEWQNLISDQRTDQIGRYTPIPRFGELNVLYDEALYTFYIGPVVADEQMFSEFRRSRQLRALRREFGAALRIDPITVEEDGAASLVVRYFEIRKQTPRETATRFAEDLRRFLAILNPPPRRATRGSTSVPPRDVVGEFEIWPSRSFGSRSAFKKLAKSVRHQSPADLPAALMPFFHLLWPDARFTPDLAASGVDIAVGSPVEVAIHCSSGDVASVVSAVESFRRTFQLVRDLIIVVNREEDTVAVREAVAPLRAALLADGTAQHVEVWNHSDHLIYAAFEMMLQRMRRAIEHWNQRMLADQARVERTLGPAPIKRVPLSRYRLRIDAVGLWKQSSPASVEIGDVAEALAHDDDRLLHIILGPAGFGKTTAVMRAARERAVQWLMIPAARIPPDAANAQSLFETAIDIEVLLDGALSDERVIWQAIAGPVLKYLTQFRSGLGIIVDALDEATVIGKSYGLQTFFNFFRRVQVPAVITMRREFWQSRQADFTAAGKSARESTVQTLEVLDLLPWTDEQIIEAARLRMAEVRQTDVRDRIETFIGAVQSGEYEHYYGDIPRTPLFLRFILDVLERRDPRNANRRDLFQYWAEQKIERDFQMPRKTGGLRLPIRRDVTTAEETREVSFRAMTEAAVCMTEIVDGAVGLLPDCTFEELSQVMGSFAPDSGESLVMNSLLVAEAGRGQRLRFAHRVFQEFFLAQAMGRFTGLRLPDSVMEWASS